MPSPSWDRASGRRCFELRCGSHVVSTGVPEPRLAGTGHADLARRFPDNFGFAIVAAALAFAPAAAFGQISTPASPQVGTPIVGPPPPQPDSAVTDPALPLLVPSTEPLPNNLTLEQALEAAEARSPAIAAARAAVAAAQGRLRQAGYRANPDLSVQVQNFLGSGKLSGLQSLEVTVAINQRLDLAGRRSARLNVGRAQLLVSELRLVVLRAELARSVRQQFATAIAARERLRIATENEARSRELSRIASILVDAGREPPLRALRAQAAASQAAAELRAAQAAEATSRRNLAALFGTDTPPESLAGRAGEAPPPARPPVESLDVRLANAQVALAEASLRQQLTERRIDPAVGVGLRYVRETGDQALVAGFSLPLRIRDRNLGNIEAARAEIRVAEAERASARVGASTRIANARANLAAASTRVEALESGAIPAGREALRLAQLSYESGKIQLIELLDAQAALRSAETQLTEARLARAEATAELARATAQ